MAKTAKTVILDFADNHGSIYAIAVRSVEFKLSGSLVSVATADITAYATTSSNTDYEYRAFDTSYPKDGYWRNSWLSDVYEVSNQRLICVFNTPIEFDEIIINNHHDSGSATDWGAKNTKIYVTNDTFTDTTYGSQVSNGTLLFDGIIPQHISSNVSDDQIIYQYTGETFSASFDIAINLSGTVFNVSFPVSIILKLTTYFPFSVGPTFSVSIPASITFSGTNSLECSPVIPYTFGYLGPSNIAYPIAIPIGISFSQQSVDLSIDTPINMALRWRIGYGNISIVYPDPEQTYSGSVVTRKYRCKLGTLEIPISTFQIRRRNGEPTYLQVSTPRFDLADDISDLSEEDIILYLDYFVDGVLVDTKELAEVEFDIMKSYSGPSSKSIVLSGHKTYYSRQPMAEVSEDAEIGEGEIASAGPYQVPNSVTIPDSNVAMVITSSGSTSLELVETDFSLEAGDIVHHSGSASFFANIITHTVSSSVHKIFVSE